MIDKKAFVLSLDASVAVVLVVLILAGSSFFFIKTNENFITNMQMHRAGSDITAVLDADGTLSTLDVVQIKSGIEDLLPTNYNMRMTINSTAYNYLIIVETESEDTGKKFIISGKRFFYAVQGGNAYPSSAKYEVWSK